MGFWGNSDKKVETADGGVYDRGPGWPSIAALSLMMVVTAVFFNNCSNEFAVKVDSEGVAQLMSVCESRIFAEFETKVSPFVRGDGKCLSCHAGPAESPDPFAAEDKMHAFEAFKFVGIKKLKSFGINPGHVPGTTGPQHANVLQAAEDSILAAENDAVCKGDGPATRPARTIAKTVNAPVVNIDPANVTAGVNQGLVVTWNLDGELATGVSDFAGAQFKATIFQGLRDTNNDGVNERPPTYYITRPTISTGAAPLEVKGIYVWINGLKISLGTTFAELDGVVPAGSADVRLSNAILLHEVSAIAATDQVAFSFDHIQRTDTNPPIVVPPTPTPTPTPLNGANLYATSCAGCHQALAMSTKRGRTAAQITAAITNVPAMRNLTLTQPQIQAIAAALQ